MFLFLFRTIPLLRVLDLMSLDQGVSSEDIKVVSIDLPMKVNKIMTESQTFQRAAAIWVNGHLMTSPMQLQVMSGFEKDGTPWRYWYEY